MTHARHGRAEGGGEGLVGAGATGRMVIARWKPRSGLSALPLAVERWGP